MKSGRARIGEHQQRARAGHHAVALVLAIGGVADLLGEREIGVLQRAHERRVHADVQRFQAIGIARGIEHAVERFGVGAGGFGQADDGAIGFGKHARRQRANNPPAARCARRAARRIRAPALRLLRHGVPGGCMPFRQLFHRAAHRSDRRIAGSTSRTRATISPITARASVGVSDAACMRHRRCSTMPESVCTMVVAAATGKT